MTTEPSVPPSIVPADQGTVLAGFLLGWVALIAGAILCGLSMGLLSLLGGPFMYLYVFSSTLPLGAMAALLVWFARQGKSRAVRGVLYAFGSMIGLGVLLVATCFVLLAGTNFH
jgi:hypothetical protein